MNRTGEVIDLFNGLGDLQKHLIKAVGDPMKRFHEDALRMMRAVRFMSQLNFELESQTKEAVGDLHQLLSKISVERIRDEFVKMGTGINSRDAFKIFLQTELSESVPDFAGKSDLLAIYPKLKFNPSMETSLWSIIIILLKISDNQIAHFMRDWKNSNAMTEKVRKIVALFDLISEKSPSDLELFNAGKDILLNTIDVAHILGQPINSEALVDRYTALPIKSMSELAIDGQFLIANGIKPGPKLGQILNEIKQKVISGELGNSKDDIQDYLQQIN